MSLIQLFRLGGWAMWPLLFFSVAVVSIVFERTVFFSRHNLKVGKIDRKSVV